MTRLNLILAAMLLACALGLVTSQHKARKLFIDLEQANNQTQQLEVRWDQLQLDQTALGTTSLIDSKARRALAMQPATPQRTLYLAVEGGPTRQGVERAAAGGAR